MMADGAIWLKIASVSACMARALYRGVSGRPKTHYHRKVCFGSPSHPSVDAKYAHAIWCIENKNIPAKLHMINIIQIKDYWNIV